LARQPFELTGWTTFIPSGVLESYVVKTLALAKTLFAMPESEKEKYSFPQKNFNIGWRRPKDSNRPDEVWQYTASDTEEFWPAHLKEEKELLLLLLYHSIEEVCSFLSDVLRETGVQPDEFIDSLRCGQSVVRLLHYLPAGNALRFNDHTDFGMLTLFAGETIGGLELIDGSGQWRPARPQPSRQIIAAGEMLSARTNGRIPPARHRVTACRDERWSIAIFLHPSPDYIVGTNEDGSKLRANDFFHKMMQRVIPYEGRKY
jgi:isopenicillin N synthase-like dioxygenase